MKIAVAVGETKTKMDSVRPWETLRRRVAESLSLPERPDGEPDIIESAPEPTDGWSLSKVDPAVALYQLPRLWLKRGWKLIGLHFSSGGNGNGVVYAVPIGCTFELAHLPSRPAEVVPGVVLGIPRPPEAAESFMDAIDSDGSFEAYAQASLLFREFQEFGAQWHGCDWSTHTILSDNPWGKTSPTRDDMGDIRDWKFKRRAPDDWSPSVRRSAGLITVTFYSVSGLGEYTLFRHRDRFHPRRLLPRSQQTVIATGPVGIVF
jgi:hypothetical protein